MSENSNQSQWKNRFQDLLHTAQVEFKRTTAIGFKMLSASQATGQLHDKLEELGRLTQLALESGDLKWDNPQAHQLVEQIQKLQQMLVEYEMDVHQIKKSG